MTEALTPSEAAEFRHKFYGNNYRSTQEVENTVLDTINAYIDLVRPSGTHRTFQEQYKDT